MLHKSLVRRLDLITLQLFVAVFEEGTLTRAAAREAIAVSAASKRLMELEQVLGVSLFVRRAKGMDLTAAGETLLHHARQMLFNVEKMGLELGEHSHGVRGYVRMLANLSAIIQFLPEDLRDFSELHPEVKTDLEERPSNGVVQGVLGIRWFDCTVTGMEAHAGPTPMALRKDALLAATRIMQDVVAAAHRHPPHGRGTVGMVQVFPNSRNVIPGQVTFSIDLRNASDALCEAMDADIRAVAAKLSADSGLPITITPVSAYPAQPFDDDCIAAVARAAEKLGYSHMRAVSGAGHDAVYMARLAPAGMIFIPCKDGISHNEIESATPEHITSGCNVLLHAMLERAGVV